jgi:integrase
MAKRDYGEGSISKRKDGTWTGRIFLGYSPEGKQVVKAVYGKTENEVKKKLKAIKTELAKYDNVNVKKVSFNELLKHWLETAKRSSLKESSYDRLEATIQNNIMPYTKHLQVCNTTADDVQKVINTLTDKGYSYSTIKKAYTTINAMLSYAVQNDYIRKNPCASVELPKNLEREKSDIEYFSDDELQSIIDGALYRHKTGRYKYKHGYAILFLANTGLRVGELLALKWENVNIDKREIYVTETRGQVKDRSDNDQKYTTTDRKTKTKAGRRTVPLNDKALEALHYFKSLGYAENPYVMANSNKGVVSYRNLFRVLDNVLKDKGIDHGSLHTLRHTFATRLLKAGEDIKTVSELLGHSDVSITYNIYIHVAKEQKKKAVDKLNEL